MRKEIYAVLIVAALLILYFSFLSETRKGIFTERLGDMTLTAYETESAAIQEISNIYALRDIPLAQGYYAVYSGSKGTMRMWVAEPTDHNIANDAFNSMNSMLGGSTGHEEHEYSGDVGQTESHGRHSDADMANSTIPVKLDFMEFVKPEVYMIKINDVYNYYYFKMNYRMGRIYWISFDSPDTDYQLSIVKQAVMDI
ncbi:hypothetical protein ANME2D_00832 [Candidatus Methanoperedens nitroreducens]|uniref:Uncharacterized protein n=1 Tax=Candidatus Methanoperedens nitratireducens TaxID=1392998 RepID=A0A062VAQ7_9EURY|nr:hypothetical protein [Candidatus Methanoperedens nitroreducens]KCZ72405.1 hypothetical protein ANME2D_00832 [Candidatus Methanoperedens nitroreducens]MDJ1423661.1 hypothetical protein [Candidatus Methanoperedens sp.]